MPLEPCTHADLPNFGFYLHTVSPDGRLSTLTADPSEISLTSPYAAVLSQRMDSAQRMAEEFAQPLLACIPYLMRQLYPQLTIHPYFLTLPDPVARPADHNLDTPICLLAVGELPNNERIPILLTSCQLASDDVDRILHSTTVLGFLGLTELADGTNNLYPDGVPCFSASRSIN